MKSALRRALALIGALLGGWLVGYVVADARLFPARRDAGSDALAGQKPAGMNSPARSLDKDDATFRTLVAEALQETGPLARRRGFSAAISVLNVNDMPDALAMICRLDEAAGYLGPELCARWAEIDPVQAAQHLLAIEHTYWFSEAMAAVMNVWTTGAPDAAKEWIASLRDRDMISLSLDPFLSAVAKSDPRRALRLKNELTSDNRTTPALRAALVTSYLDRDIFVSWGVRNGTEAVQEALNLPEFSVRYEALMGALTGWGLRDLRAAVRFAATLPPPFSRKAVVESLVNYPPPDVDPDEVAACILELPAGRLRTAALGAAMDYLSTHDLALAQRLIADVPQGGLAAGMQSRIATALAANDPEAAAAFLAGLPPGRSRDTGVDNLAQTWAQSDPEAALKWAAQLPTAKSQQAATFRALQTWSEHEPASAAIWTVARLSDEKAAEVLVNICDEWSRSDTVAVLDWALTLPDGESRKAALRSVVGPLAASDPARAIQLFSELPYDSKYATADQLASQWAESDPVSAARWALQLTDEDLRRDALSGVMQTWAVDDAAAAEDWVRTMPPGTARDMAAAQFIDTTATNDPASAVGIVSLIADAEQRDFTASNLISKWKRIDKAAALAWLRTTPALPPDARKRILLDLEPNER